MLFVSCIFLISPLFKIFCLFFILPCVFSIMRRIFNLSIYRINYDKI
nr:MAG TPA: hypothetical protein [Caudoviricetes sp.]